jgi:hypothetical protein
MKRLAFTAAAVAVIAYCVLGAYHFFDIEDEPDAASVIAGIRQTGPGWQR